MKSAVTLSGDFAVPELHEACSKCGSPTARAGLCGDCGERREAAQEAIRTTRDSIPRRFAWARGFDVPELPSRVDGTTLAQARALDLRSLDRVTLLGAAGAGKSSLACAIANAWATANASAGMFVAAVDLGVARQQHGLGEGEPVLVRKAMGAKLLVLDDVGQEADIGVAVLVHVLHRRYDDARPTVTTSGLSVEQLLKRYGSGVARRLLETSGGAMVLKLRSRNEREDPR